MVDSGMTNPARGDRPMKFKAFLVTPPLVSGSRGQLLLGCLTLLTTRKREKAYIKTYLAKEYNNTLP